MNRIQRKNLIYRLISSSFLLIFVGALSVAFYKVIIYSPEAIILDYIAFILTALFAILQMIFILKGWKKDSHLYDIIFNKNETRNNVPFIAVIIGTVISIGLTVLAVVLYFQKSEVEIKCNLIIIATISLYLLTNCAIYFLYLIMFRKRTFKLEDLIK